MSTKCALYMLINKTIYNKTSEYYRIFQKRKISSGDGSLTNKADPLYQTSSVYSMIEQYSIVCTTIK